MQKNNIKNVDQIKNNKVIPELVSGSSTHAVAVVKQGNPLFNKRQTTRVEDAEINSAIPNFITANAARGFTLIELLVVVLIIGILAAVALPQYQKAVTKSKLVQLKTIVESIAKAQETLYLAQGQYTNDIEALSISFPPAQEITKADQTTLTYPWGSCAMSNILVSCMNGKAGIYYLTYYEHNSHTNKRECSARITKSVPTQICKQETGKDTYFWTDGTWAAYAY